MDGSAEKCNFKICEWFREERTRNSLIALTAGILFWSGWWIIFDVEAHHPSTPYLDKTHHFCGIFGTVSLIMVNSISTDMITTDNTSTSPCCGRLGARIWLFWGLFIGFSALIASIWIMIEHHRVEVDEFQDPLPLWPAWGLFLQNMFIFASSMIMRFGRTSITNNF
ncbi:transmembrane protein 50B-like [Periplaneta americana]|uniref:transmembrane protein 50B-like n=1 Tax=Periplaneta americana TaxID=6978 RepID=UPI0037E7CD72